VLQILRTSGREAMQISPQSDDRTAIRAGDLVVVRRCRWRVVDVRAYEACAVVTLSGVSAPVAGLHRRLLTPFDTLHRVDRPRGTRFVPRRRWRRACRSLVAANRPPATLRTASTAAIELMPYQLEPALAVLAGAGVRLLLADDVGLGKTIQAGLVVSELRARAAADRILIVTPAGLRDQWARELAERFAIRAESADGRALRRRLPLLPTGVNPWSTLATAIASVDYIKRAEVFPSVAACDWDLVIVDEAHAVAADSDRYEAVHALAARASYVLLLTATPHNGDRHAFDALCTLGAAETADAIDPQLLVFRRTRADVGISTTRRTHALFVRLSPAERRMHLLLQRYGDAIRAERRAIAGHDACLALSVLHKRAFSSAWSLARSVDRRLAALDSGDPGADAAQLALPLGDPDGDLIAADAAPSWPAELRLADERRERELLSTLASSAAAAARRESKIAALQRLLRRAGESAIVFTEYRDTLRHVHDCLSMAGTVAPLTLHGGMPRDERARVVDDFSEQHGRILLATDAAAEGLNLHRRCRLIVNLELPWNPMRLEQRIGRVDRIGQRRTVHAFQFIARGTGEPRILARLQARVAAAQADLGAPDPVGGGVERSMARLVAGGDHDDDEDGRLPG